MLTPFKDNGSIDYTALAKLTAYYFELKFVPMTA